MTNPVSRVPRLSIGLPVFNGGHYLKQVLDSILAQTWTDFELIISDNASTDGTESLCLEYAASDGRIRYLRNDTNIGASQNWFRVLDLATAEYFASVAHDDVYEPDYMRKCIEVLERDPSTLVCYTKTRLIDSTGAVTGVVGVEVDTTSDMAHKRLYQVLRNEFMCIQLYGVMRTSALRSTTVFVGYYGCDRNTLAELVLMGKLREVPEYLFLHRIHPEALGAGTAYGKTADELMSIDPGIDWQLTSANGKTDARILRNYFRSVSTVIEARTNRLWCYGSLLRFLFDIVLERIDHQIKRLPGRLRRLMGRLGLARR